MTGKDFEDPINLRVILEKMTADIDAIESAIRRMAKESLARAGEVEALRNELHSVKVRSQILLDAKNDIIVALRANLEDAERVKEALRLQLSDIGEILGWAPGACTTQRVRDQVRAWEEEKVALDAMADALRKNLADAQKDVAESVREAEGLRASNESLRSALMSCVAVLNAHGHFDATRAAAALLDRVQLLEK